MSDKDLLVVISEMLRKQDQQAEILKETSETLKHFVDISIQQFEQQLKFNEQQQEFNQQQLGFNQQQQEFNGMQQNFNERFLEKLDQQSQFNDRFLNKLDDIEKAIKK